MTRRTETWLAVCLPPVVCGAVAVALGFDANWDLRNYHYYNAYAFLTGRGPLDVAPGQLQTFHSPLLDVPFYWMSQFWAPVWVGAAIGALHGLNLTLLWLILDQATDWPEDRSRRTVGLLLVWLGLRGPGFMAELGNTMNDNLISVFVLLSLWLLLRAWRASHAGATWRSVAVAGLVMGAGVGLKPTIAPFAIGAGVALFALWPAWRDRLRAMSIYGAAGVSGTLAAAGFWWWHLWVTYGNPFFPYLNHVFRSPFVQPIPFTDTRFLPRTWWEYLTWPLVFGADSSRVSEQPFRDLRFVLLYCLALSCLGVWLVRALRRASPSAPSETVFRAVPLRFLAIFAGLSFALWACLFSIYRYLVPLELLAPVLAFAALAALLRSGRAQLEIGVALVVGSTVAFQPLDLGRAHWPGRYIEVRNLSALGLGDRSVVMLLGTAPLSYVIPSFPPAVRFVRPEGNLSLRPENRFYQQVAAALAEADGVYVVYLAGDSAVDLSRTLAQWGLGGSRPDCGRLDTNIPDNLTVCRITKE